MKVSAIPSALLIFVSFSGSAAHAASAPADAGMSFLSPSASAACVPGPTTLCLNGERFRVEVEWRDFADRTGVGQAVPLTGDTGYFWFFSPNNVELVIKVLDGRSLNNSFWVFYGALSNVEYTITVTDTATGATRRYFNPSGQFASVGDTSAFPQGALAPLSVDPGALLRPLNAPPSIPNGIIEPASAAVSEPTCLSHTQGLCLNSGRFAVEVDWKDFAGNEGRGKAVALSGDTGYFWFFSESNVELVVKALDARALGAGFWVFYGALSNVEYEITVVDTLTGVAKTYSNPSGQFASVGDTSAFRAGYPFVVSLDEGRAASAEMTPAGGEISATGADGSVYTLRLPPDALLSAETITLTPVTSIERLPLSGGLAAAVQLAPQGLILLEPATLTIVPAAPVPPSEEISFAWRGSGEEFFLHPLQLDPSRASFSLLSLGGFGIGRGTPADQDAQLPRVPGSPNDELSQKLQPLVAQLRRQSVAASSRRPLSPADLGADLEATLRRHYQNDVRPVLEAASRRCVGKTVGVTNLYREWIQRVEDNRFQDRFAAELEQARRLAIAVAERCYNDKYDECVRRRDPRHGAEMVYFYRDLALAGVASLVEVEKISRCLTFELSFFSHAEAKGLGGLWRSVEKVEVSRGDPIVLSPRLPEAFYAVARFILYPDRGAVPGPCKDSDYVLAGCTQVPETETCDWVGLTVDRLEINVNAHFGARPRDWVVLYHFPGGTEHGVTMRCPNVPPLELDNVAIFFLVFFENHRSEWTAVWFAATNWGFDSPVMLKQYFFPPGVDGLFHEETVIRLVHAPR